MAVLQTYSATSAALGPLAQWRFAESAGTTLIDSAGGLDGAYQGDVTFGAAGATGTGGAVRFGGGGFAVVQSASGGDFTVELAAFGDSLVQGFGLTAGEFLNEQLKAALDARGLDSTVTPFGQNGRTTGQALGATQGVINSDPDGVVIVLGTNDALNGRDIAPGTTEDNLRTIIERFQGADIEVLLTGTFGLFPDESSDEPGFEETDDPAGNAAAFEAIFPRLAAEFGLELFDPYHGGARVGDEIIGGTLGDSGLNQGDGVHPNGAGVGQIVDRMVPQAMLVAAASGALQAPNEPLLLANGTIEAWFNADDVTARQGLFSKDAAGQGTGGHVSAAIQNGRVSVGLEGLDGGAFVQGAVEAGADTQLVFTFGAGGLQLFINGELVDTDGFTGGLDIGVDGLGNFEPLVIGALIEDSPNRAAGTPSNGFNGVFDELAIYDRALSADEIQQLFAAGQTGGRLVGGTDADTLLGGVDDEMLRGRGGDDELQGGGGDDVLKGNGGADLLVGGDGDDRLIGGGGQDELRGEAGNDVLEGRGGPDALSGGAGNDTLRGNKSADTIAGEEGDDTIFGDRGRDTIDGGPGDDLIDGGRGGDLIAGGTGADRIVIARLGDGIDEISGFELGAGGDALELGAVLEGFDPASSRPADFVRLEAAGGDTTVAVNADGAGSGFTAVATLLGIGGANLSQLVADGNIQLT